MQSYFIDDGHGTRAEILPEKGATAVSFTRQGVEFLYRDQENLDSPERPRCGIPFLFPIFGRLKDGVYTWQGKQYPLAIHGFAHTSPWQVVWHSADTLCLTLDAGSETLAVYPFRFRVELAFTVADGTLTIDQQFENTGSESMPYNFGFHPYFRVEDLSHAQVEATAQTHFDFAVGPRPFGHGTVTLTMPEGAPETGGAFMGVTAPAKLHIPAEGRRVTLEFPEDFPQLVLWTQRDKQFLCVEPINGTADGLNQGIYLTLAPGEVKRSTLRIHAELI